MEQNEFSNFGEGASGGHLCELILKLEKGFRRKCALNKRNYFSKFGRGSSEEQFCEIILKSAQWPWRRCRSNVFLFSALTAILFSGAVPF